MVELELVEYIAESLTKGYPIDSIKKILIKEGKKTQEIDLAINEAFRQISSKQSENNTFNQFDSFSNSQNSEPVQNNISNSNSNNISDNNELNMSFSSHDNLKYRLKDKFQNYETSQDNNSNNNNNNQSNYEQSENNNFSVNLSENSTSNNEQQSVNQNVGKNGRPSRHVMHQSLKDLSLKLDSHSKIMVIGVIILFIIIFSLMGTVLFMFIQLKTTYNIQLENAPKSNVAICGYCEYFSDGGCNKYSCCSSSDCDDFNVDTLDRCMFPSTKDARCTNTDITLIIPQIDKQNSIENKTQQVLDNSEIILDNTTLETTIADNISEVKDTKDCLSNIDCEDNNPATRDMCLGSPKKVCLNLPITSCLPNDGYCPLTCTTETDSDCV